MKLTRQEEERNKDEDDDTKSNYIKDKHSHFPKSSTDTENPNAFETVCMILDILI